MRDEVRARGLHRDADGDVVDPVDNLDEHLEPDAPIRLSDPQREAAIAAM